MIWIVVALLAYRMCRRQQRVLITDYEEDIWLGKKRWVVQPLDRKHAKISRGDWLYVNKRFYVEAIDVVEFDSMEDFAAYTGEPYEKSIGGRRYVGIRLA
jgi:ASC-1-like (ASCH) protein